MKPTDIKKSAPQVLQLEWDNGEMTYYPFELLRQNCPCANCNEARLATENNTDPFRILEPNEILPDQMDIIEAEVVGRYAISFSWNDGHKEGIYTFDFLRELAENEVCQKLKKENSAKVG